MGAEIGRFFSSAHWLLIAFVAPAFWAVVNIIDVYFVGGIYDDEYDGAIISSLFQLLPWAVLIFFVDLNFSSHQSSFYFDPALFWAFLGGMAFSLAFLFYFKSLFSKNDVAMLQIFWNLTVILVPLMTFLVFGENLGFYKYLGMGVVFFGASLLSSNSRMKLKISRQYVIVMLAAIFFLSLSMVLEDRAYSLLGDGGFWLGYFFFSAGCFVSGIGMIFWKKRNIWPMVKKRYKIFILAEAISFLGTMASQRAINISPSVSYVSTIEATSVLFVILFSFGILGYLHLTGKKDGIFQKIYSEQVDSMWIKIVSLAFVAGGIYIIGS